jgi:hypothetical protein
MGIGQLGRSRALFQVALCGVTVMGLLGAELTVVVRVMTVMV